MSVALGNLDKHITALLGGWDVDSSSSRDGSLRGDNRGKDILAISANSDNTDGVGDVLDGGDSRVCRLLDIGSLVLLDKRSLEGSTTSKELGGVDSRNAGSRGLDLGRLREDTTEIVSNTGGMSSTTRQDNLVNVKNIEASLLDDTLDKSVETLKDLAGNHLISYSVDSDREVETVGQAFNTELGVAAQAQSSLGSLGLESELGKTAGIVSRVDVVLLLEFLSEVLHKGVVQVDTSEFIVVRSGKNGVEATSRGDDSNIGSGATKVSNNNGLVLDLGLGTGIVSQNSGNRVGNKLENFKTSLVSGLDQGLSLLLGEVCGNSNNGRGDLLAQVVGSGTDKSSQVPSGSLRNWDSRSIILGLILHSESDRTGNVLRVGGGVGVGRVDRLESGRFTLVCRF